MGAAEDTHGYGGSQKVKNREEREEIPPEETFLPIPWWEEGKGGSLEPFLFLPQILLRS